MIYLSVAFNIALVVLVIYQRFTSSLDLEKERAAAAHRDDEAAKERQELVNQIILLKVDPAQAVVQTYPEIEEQPHIPVDDSPYADQAWAEYLEKTS